MTLQSVSNNGINQEQDNGELAQQQRAIYNSPENFFNWSWPSVPRHQFLSERDRAFDPDGDTGLIELDISDKLQTPYPATIPAILARYIRINAGDKINHSFIASGEVYYVLKGDGLSRNGADKVSWGTGDVFCFPGGNETTHKANDTAIIFCVTNEPLLAFENLQAPLPGKSRNETVHWPHEEIEKHLSAIYERQKQHKLQVCRFSSLRRRQLLAGTQFLWSIPLLIHLRLVVTNGLIVIMEQQLLWL